jgi:hypothetical protein
LLYLHGMTYSFLSNIPLFVRFRANCVLIRKCDIYCASAAAAALLTNLSSIS